VSDIARPLFAIVVGLVTYSSAADTGPEVFENAPLGLQIATPAYTEEMCLAVSETIDGVLNRK
jgi:Asp-tRNA(Asn)/Glu-tRNA(Gln) amidotransferase A subunit family amidase